MKSSTIQATVLALTVLPLCPLAIVVAAWSGWTAGTAALLLWSLPLCLLPFFTSRKDQWAVAPLVVATCLAEAYWGTTPADAMWRYTSAVCCALELLLLQTLVAGIFGRLVGRWQRLDDHHAKIVRQVYELQQQIDKQQQADAAALPGLSVPESCDAPDDRRRNILPEEAINYAMLLLTLQDISRQVSMDLSLERLLPTIINTAKSSLSCRVCQIFLWDSRRAVLRSPWAKRQRDEDEYEPHPQHGMGSWVLQHRRILTRGQLESKPELAEVARAETNPPAAIAPLIVGGEILGLLVVDEIENHDTATERLLYILASTYALGIKNAQLFDRIAEMARRDGLTGLLNHAAFQQELQDQIRENESDGRGLTVVMSDLDHFKEVNDSFGHPAGDYVLQQVARLWQATLPDRAVIGRYGGEEFVCLLTDTDIEEGRHLAEELREVIAEFPFSYEGRLLQVTSSFGVAAHTDPRQSAMRLVRQADDALYQAKETGRNRVICATGGNSQQKDFQFQNT